MDTNSVQAVQDCLDRKIPAVTLHHWSFEDSGNYREFLTLPELQAVGATAKDIAERIIQRTTQHHGFASLDPVTEEDLVTAIREAERSLGKKKEALALFLDAQTDTNQRTHNV